MSRSAPTTDKAPNPAVHFFEWAGGAMGGFLQFWDKSQKQTVQCDPPFQFLALDELATVKGWHDASESGIFANEVRSTKSEPLTVKAFKGGILAEGYYADIKAAIHEAGGYYTASIYCAFKEDGRLKIGAVQFKGAALNAWVNFRKEAGGKIWEKAVVITGSEEGKKGSIKFKTPTFALKDVSEESNAAAKVLDEELQAYLYEYFSRTRPAAPASLVVPAVEPRPPLPEVAREDGDDVAF